MLTMVIIKVMTMMTSSRRVISRHTARTEETMSTFGEIYKYIYDFDTADIAT